MPEVPRALDEIRGLIATAPLEALEAVRQFLGAAPRSSEALRLAASAHRALGERDLAEHAEIAAIDAARELPAIAKATRLIAAGEFGEASRIAAEHLQRQPDDLAALTLSAEAAIALGLPDKAIPLLEAVMMRAPSYLLARALLIDALAFVDRLRDARAVLDPIVRRMPQAPRFQRLTAQIAARQGRYDEAIEASATVARLDPQSPENWAVLGDHLRFAGRREDAVAAYRKALDAQPGYGRAWWSLADIDAAALSDADRETMRRAASEHVGDPELLCNLQFAQAMVADARKEYAGAFAHFAAGNATRQATQTDDPAPISAQTDHYLAATTAQSIPPLAQPPSGGATPLFIVGMPRSGSTLVERALGRHSQIEALGELPIVPHMVERIGRDAPGRDPAPAITGLPPESLAAMGEWYLARSGELARAVPRACYRTDKMHMNWRHLPLILRMLPHARVIDVRRGAMDCCWSNYRTLFARGHPAADDLRGIAQFYRDYLRLADGLRERAPTRIRLARYEDIIDDFEGGMRAMLDWLDLPFEAEVIDFHLSRDPVATASSEQVRRPLNRKGVGAWKPYAEWLDPLRDALGDLAEA